MADYSWSVNNSDANYLQRGGTFDGLRLVLYLTTFRYDANAKNEVLKSVNEESHALSKLLSICAPWS